MAPELDEVRRWLDKADRDRTVARLALDNVPPITDAAAFHAQQAVEKLLKAYLVFKRQPFEKIHDLGELIDRCQHHDRGFVVLRDSVAGLTPYAVRFRYPGPGDPSTQQVQSALTVVDDVRAFVISILPDELGTK